MRRTLTIATPENVTLSFELAGAGSRLVACLFDSILQAAGVAALVALVVGGLEMFQSLGLGFFWGSAVFLALVGIAIFALLSGYYIFFETRWNGQTPGKKAMGLRVIRDGGLPIDFAAAVVRNLCRAADFLPAFYGAGLISILVSGESKRLGDYVAGTLVVKERQEGEIPSPQSEGLRPDYRFLAAAALRRISQVSRDQYQAAKRYLERARDLTPAVARPLAERIVAPIAEALGAQPPAADWAGFLAEVVTAYEHRVLRRLSALPAARLPEESKPSDREKTGQP